MGETSYELCKNNCFIHLDTPHAFCNLPLVRTNPWLVPPYKNMICHKFFMVDKLVNVWEAIMKTIIDLDWLVFVNFL
jgi:hypothetical protein